MTSQPTTPVNTGGGGSTGGCSVEKDRRKGQHSAPRGGPPRAWTNADLTEALHHVWNRKMTTSQASRVFCIPYNSLLMYVRGKYGKSLKLDTLRKETLEGEAMALAASTRGSYKLAAAAAAATASKPSPSGSLDNSITHNNNKKNSNNNNNNNVESKTAGKNGTSASHLHLAGLNLSGYPSLSPMADVDAHALGMGLGMGAFGGLNASAINPYLSYFCDFSFPMPMVGLGNMGAGKHHGGGVGGGAGGATVAANSVSSKKTGPASKVSESQQRRAKAKVDRDPEVDHKDDSNDEGGVSPEPPSAVNLRLVSSLIAPLADLPQTGQV